MVSGTTGLTFNYEKPKKDLSKVDQFLNSLKIKDLSLHWDRRINMGLWWWELFYKNKMILQFDPKFTVDQFNELIEFLHKNKIDSNYKGNVPITGDTKDELFVAIIDIKERNEFVKIYIEKLKQL